jgi:hypothetical protein
MLAQAKKSPRQHLGLDFRQLSTLKNDVLPRVFFSEKNVLTKMVTKSPDLTVNIKSGGEG